MEDKWLAQAKRLQALASTGLHFSNDVYDRERYSEIAGIAQTMLADLGQVPLHRITGLVSDFAQGYATPKIDVRGAVIRDGRILLVREAADGLWTLPGGFAHVGLSAAENIVKEIQEEAGLSVTARHLYGVRHKAKHAYDADARDFYKFFFLCDQPDDAEPETGPETTDVGFFEPTTLPALSRGRVIEADIHAAFRSQAAAVPATFFD